MSNLDLLGRPLGSLRVSVTDRCNLRCQYCMPEDEYVWLPRTSILSFEEVDRVVRVFARLGVTKVRLTGGEPLLRQDVSQLVALLASIPGVADLAMTTNGILLSRYATALRSAGLGRLTVSLDTLREDRFRELTRASRHAEVIDGIHAARAAGFTGLKINTVVIRGYNDDELEGLIEFGRQHVAEIRFIEYMDVGGATRWSMGSVFTREEILARLSARYGEPTPVDHADPAAPAQRFALPDGTTFGIIASTTAPFCRTCDRSRITADGVWFLCLYAAAGVDLRGPIREGASDDDLTEMVRDGWRKRADRGAEERLGLGTRKALYQIESLRLDPHQEMHTRGG